MQTQNKIPLTQARDPHVRDDQLPLATPSLSPSWGMEGENRLQTSTPASSPATGLAHLVEPHFEGIVPFAVVVASDSGVIDNGLPVQI